MFINKALLYYHTLKHIKLRQGWHRVRRLHQKFRRVRYPNLSAKPVRADLQPWQQYIVPKSPVISDEPLRFEFLNRPTSSTDKLWHYNYHYHAVLLADVDLLLKKKIMRQWVIENPIGQGGNGWEPYPLSLRIVNWIKWADAEFNDILYAQCLALESQIEFHLLGNHLFENAKALVFAGVYFDTEDSARWIKQGMALLQAEINEQILADGGHFERSPMYHCIILEGMLDLYQLCELANLPMLQEVIAERLPSMLHWLHLLLHQDGHIAFFNDTTFGIAAEPQSLFAYAEHLGFHTQPPEFAIRHLKDSGFLRMENSDALVLADVGSLGPAYIPGHAHAGTLSCEIALRGERLFVNRGISTYNANHERLQERSTLAHNTVTVAGQSSSQVWSSFRVAKRAKIIETAQDQTSFTAAHDGYRRLPQNIVHQRKWTLQTKKIIIEDQLTGKGAAPITANYHLHPDWQVAAQHQDTLDLKSTVTGNTATVKFSPHAEIKVIPYEYAVGFNKKISGWCISVNMQQSLPIKLTMELGW